MKLITASELANKTNFELSALYARLKEELAGVDPDSYEYEILCISLENIRRAYAAPRFKPPGM
jgi:hypothetical protein